MDHGQQNPDDLPDIVPESLTPEGIEEAKQKPRVEFDPKNLAKWEREERNERIAKYCLTFCVTVGIFSIIAFVLWNLGSGISKSDNPDLRMIVILVAFFGTFFMVRALKKK